MIMDERIEFADGTALDTSGTNTDLIGDVYDTGGDGWNEANGLYLVIQVSTAVTSGGSATVQFHLASDAAAAIATDGSATYHWSSGDVAVADLTAGYYAAKIQIPAGEYERYVGILTTTGTAALTGGAINAFVTPDIKTWKAFANAAGASIS